MIVYVRDNGAADHSHRYKWHIINQEMVEIPTWKRSYDGAIKERIMYYGLERIS